MNRVKYLIWAIGTTAIMIVSYFIYIKSLIEGNGGVINTYNHIELLLSNELAINIWLIRAFAIVVASFLGYCFIETLSHDEERKIRGMLMSTGLLSLGALGIFFITKDYTYNKDGSPRQCCSKNLLEEYELIPCDWKVHPKYGTPNLPCSVNALQKIKDIDSKNTNTIEIDVQTRFFSIEGRPLVWYFEHDNGKLEFFDNKGIHPILGKPLTPITPKVAKKTFSFLQENRDTMFILSNKTKISYSIKSEYDIGHDLMKTKELLKSLNN